MFDKYQKQAFYFLTHTFNIPSVSPIFKYWEILHYRIELYTFLTQWGYIKYELELYMWKKPSQKWIPLCCFILVTAADSL